MLANEKSRSGALEAALVKARDAGPDQSSLAANARWFLDSSLQKTTWDFFMLVLDHVRAAGLLLRTNTSEHCSGIETMARARHEDISRAIAKELDRARSLAEFGANDKCAVGCSSGTSGDGGHSSSADRSSSLRHPVRGLINFVDLFLN